MAAVAKRKTTYASYGNTAYDPAYYPQREREAEGRPLVRPRERVRARPRAMVRESGKVAPAAVLGFLLVGALAVVLLFSYVQMTVASNQVISLRNQSAALQKENSKLLTQYELAYDLKGIEETVTASGQMVQPQSGQLITLNLSEPDSTQVLTPAGGDFLREAWDGLTQAVMNIVAYFR